MLDVALYFSLTAAALRLYLAMSDFPLSVAAWGWASADGRLEPESELGSEIFTDGPFSALSASADVMRRSLRHFGGGSLANGAGRAA